ncbi:MAG: NAD(P)-dependent oxidoreductase [Rhizobiaceae bacterium]|nr:NAD(P)-dependent oxidoreductase [Rhizobiaceae bacterium]
MPSNDRSAAAGDDTVAFVGLGRMGAPMVRCLAKAGYKLRLYDVDRSISDQLAAETGGEAAASLSRLGQDAGIVILMLPNSKIVEQVCLGSEGREGLVDGLGTGGLIIDMSSSNPMATRTLGATLKENGIALVDAPVSGGIRKAVDGTLSIMVGGDDEAACQRATPVLEAMGKTFRTGALGSGHAIKALNNYVSAAGLAAACEAVVVAKSFGLDPALMIDVINASTGRNHSTEIKIKPFVLSGEFRKAGFALDLMTKDVETAADLADRLGLSLPGLDAARQLWKEAAAKLDKGADHTEIFRYIEDAGNGVDA